MMEMHFMSEAYSLDLKVERKLLRRGHNEKKKGVEGEEQLCERQDGESSRMEIGSVKEDP
jgi:hypothetical protein